MQGEASCGLQTRKIGDIFRRAQKETTVRRREHDAEGGEAVADAGRVWGESWVTNLPFRLAFVAFVTGPEKPLQKFQVNGLMQAASRRVCRQLGESRDRRAEFRVPCVPRIP